MLEPGRQESATTLLEREVAVPPQSVAPRRRRRRKKKAAVWHTPFHRRFSRAFSLAIGLAFLIPCMNWGLNEEAQSKEALKRVRLNPPFELSQVMPQLQDEQFQSTLKLP